MGEGIAWISAFYFESSPGRPMGIGAKTVRNVEIPEKNLSDATNSKVLTGKQLTKLGSDSMLQKDATLMVLKGSQVDASLLVNNATENQIVIVQESDPSRFGANISRLASRDHSTDLAVFDYSPMSDRAITEMGVNGTLSEWRGFSDGIARDFRVVGAANAIKSRDIQTLLRRLKDSQGGVVIIYAHSDGNSLYLDTDAGIVKFGVEDIKKLSVETGGKLPPIVLLNCNAAPLLGSAFLNAGSPLVMATDMPLGLGEARTFLKRVAQEVFVRGSDVVDATYDAQSKSGPFRMKPMVELAPVLISQQQI